LVLLFCNTRELFFNSGAHSFETVQNLEIREADYADALRRQDCGSPFIVALSRIAEMRVPVQLDHEAVLSAIEVGDVRTQRLLPREFLVVS
jgi:hypothetical protein